MNKARRKELAEIVELLEEARERLEAVRDEEEEALENLPESLQASERGEAMQAAIDAMEDVLAALDTGALEESSGA